MTDTIQVIAAISTAAILVSLMFFVLSKERKKIREGIRRHKAMAEMSKTKNQLMGVRMSLVDWTQKNCWHPSQVTEARIVLAYIDGKLAQYV